MGGGGTLVLEKILRPPEPSFLFFAWYGPGLFFSQDHAYKTKQKKVHYISVDSDLEMDTRLIQSLVL